jgi:hypothetical protein
MFRNNAVCDFRNDFNYLKISKSDLARANEAVGLSGSKPEVLEGTEHMYYGFYRNDDMLQMKQVLEVYNVESEIYRKAENAIDKNFLTGNMD